MAILAMRGHGQDARATSELTLKGAVEEGLEEAVPAVTLLPEVESSGKTLTGSGAGLLEYQPGVGFHFRFSMNATPNSPH